MVFVNVSWFGNLKYEWLKMGDDWGCFRVVDLLGANYICPI